MKHSNIAIFIPHSGCPHTCSFCNQRTISGAQKAPTPEEVRALLSKSCERIKDQANTQIAFFGGSFTAVERGYMVALLQVAAEFTEKYHFAGIRISTRPDAITPEILILLKQYHVTAIELGAQSMDDAVLLSNERGHTAEDVRKAAALIREYGFELGVQMMVSLYGDDEQGALYTAKQLIGLAPQTVRIYPTVILRGTKLASLYESGAYKPIPFDNAVTLSAALFMLFQKNGIQVIKLGLHASVDVEKEMVGGIYHPAFKELCEARIYYDAAKRILLKNGEREACLFVNSRALSKMRGQKRENVKRLMEDGFDVTVKPDDSLADFEIKMGTDVETCF